MSAVIVYSHCVEENGKLRVGWNSNPEIGNVQQNDQVQFITRSFMTQKTKICLLIPSILIYQLDLIQCH